MPKKKKAAKEYVVRGTIKGTACAFVKSATSKEDAIKQANKGKYSEAEIEEWEFFEFDSAEVNE